MHSKALLTALYVATSLACLVPAPAPSSRNQTSPAPSSRERISTNSMLVYPQGDASYGQTKTTQWIFNISKDEEVKLTFETFETSPSRDVLEIFDGDVKVAYFTGKSVPLYPTFVKADSSKVKFTVSSKNPLAGFTIRAEYVSATTGKGTFTFDEDLGGWQVAHSDTIGWKHQQKGGSEAGNIKFDSTSPTSKGGWAELDVELMSTDDWAELVSPRIVGVQGVSLWRLKMNVNDHYTKSSFRVMLRQKDKQDKLIWQNDNNGGFHETVSFSEWTHREIDIRLPSAGSSFQIVIKVVNINFFGRGNRRVGIDDVTISSDHLENPENQMCGIDTQNVNRIFNGKPSDSHKWPWIVLVNIVLYNGKRRRCTGSIVDKRWILTAMHCVTQDPRGLKFNQIHVVFGLHARSKYAFNKDPDQYSIRIDKIYTPRDINYSKDGAGVSYSKEDVALLKLPADLQFTSKVSPVCLPEKNDALPDGAMLTFAGWGYNPNVTSEQNKELNEVQLKLKRHCPESRGRRYLCTYSRNRDVCMGDSGGPGMIYDETSHQWKLVASVGYGPSCDDLAKGRSKDSGYSADIIRIIDWINHIMKTY